MNLRFVSKLLQKLAISSNLLKIYIRSLSKQLLKYKLAIYSKLSKLLNYKYHPDLKTVLLIINFPKEIQRGLKFPRRWMFFLSLFFQPRKNTPRRPLNIRIVYLAMQTRP